MHFRPRATNSRPGASVEGCEAGCGKPLTTAQASRHDGCIYWPPSQERRPKCPQPLLLQRILTTCRGREFNIVDGLASQFPDASYDAL